MMKKGRKLTILMLLVLPSLFSGCSPSREKTVGQIRSLETRLFSPEAVSFDKVKADSLLVLYENFIKDHPKDSLSPGFLFKEASIYMNSGNGTKALALFDQYLKSYPDQPKASLCLFFKGFVNENLLGNLDNAREIYLQFIEKYPNNDFTDDAKLALQNLGKTPDQMVREFELRQKADSTRQADSLAALKKGKKRK